MTLPLLELYPAIRKRLQPLSLCNLPTPVDTMHADNGLPILIKRDDVSAAGYGGNKVRKLEFLLADARMQRRNTVLTFGFAGSNFAAATAWYARSLGMDCISLLLPQAAEPYVRSNLLLQQASGARCVQRDSVTTLGAAAIWQSLRARLSSGAWPYWIPAGGSSAVGVLGFVNAALELQLQMEAQQQVMPTHLYVAVGSMGSVAGLAVGMALAGVHTRIVGVRVVEKRFAHGAGMQKLVNQVLQWLGQSGIAVPSVSEVMSRMELRHDYFGAGYGIPSMQDRQAMQALGEAGFVSDPAYSSKAMACLLDDIAAGTLEGQRPCFWLTCNGHPLDALIAEADWQLLPPPFHGYFDNQ